jgi:hypothetical protein
MDKQSRREAIRQYKDQAPDVGVFALRCAATGQAWVGMSKNLGQLQNRVFFGLRQGGHPNREVQAAWNAHGAEAFRFEVLEVIDPEGLSALGLDSRLKDRDRHWREALGVPKLAG